MDERWATGSFPLTVKDAVKTFSPDGRWIATYEKNGAVKLWKMPESKVVRTLKGERGKVLLLAFSPDGKFLAAASHDLGVVKVWRTGSGDLVRSLSLGANRILNLAVSPSGDLLGTVMLRLDPKLREQTYLELWHLPTGKRL
ncbi:WD domain-containing protein, G-beta repeat-containing protein, partial [Candidatus Fervidibacteria bacterium JGI MDM2 JNZ-1-D12]